MLALGNVELEGKQEGFASLTGFVEVRLPGSDNVCRSLNKGKDGRLGK